VQLQRGRECTGWGANPKSWGGGLIPWANGKEGVREGGETTARKEVWGGQLEKEEDIGESEKKKGGQERKPQD